MSVLTAPTPPIVGVPSPPTSEAAAGRTVIGFVVMALVTSGDFVADPRIAARHIRQA